MEDLDKLQETLTSIVGAKWVTKQTSHIVVRPKASEETSEILKAANRFGTPVTPRGNGTGWWGTAQPKKGGIVIDMTRMNDILVIDEDAMTVTVDAGITFSELESKLHVKGYRIMNFPESGRAATVGGHIETWGTGPHISAVFEDQSTQLVALKVVLPTGEIVQTGSGAVTTAAGNFARRFFPSDIVGLFAGAEGAFGIITEATLKMYELPEAMITRMIGVKDLPSAIAVMRKIQRAQRRGGLSTIIEQRLQSRESLTASIPKIKETPENFTIFIRIRGDGDAVDVQHHIAEVFEFSKSEGGYIVEDDFSELYERHFTPNPYPTGGPRVLIVAMVPLGKFLEANELATKFGEKHNRKINMMGYPFGAPVILAHASIRSEDSTQKGREKALSLGRELMEELVNIGCVPHRVGTDFLPVITEKLDPAYYDLVKRIKKLLDPNGIMNPGAVVADNMPT